MTKLTRTEISKKHGIHKGKLRSIINLQPELRFPRPVDKTGNSPLYDAAAVESFFVKNPIDEIVWRSQASTTNNPTLQIDNDMVLQFIKGMYAHESVQVENARRLIKSRRRAEYSDKFRKTVRIRECML